MVQFTDVVVQSAPCIACSSTLTRHYDVGIIQDKHPTSYNNVSCPVTLLTSSTLPMMLSAVSEPAATYTQYITTLPMMLSAVSEPAATYTQYITTLPMMLNAVSEPAATYT